MSAPFLRGDMALRRVCILCGSALQSVAILLLGDYFDACDRMNFHPLCMECVLHIASHDTNVRAHTWQRNLILITHACGLGVSLSHMKLADRSEEHTSELQSPCNLVCRLLLEKKNILVLRK